MENDVLYQMIFKRKSFHLFRNVNKVPLTEAELSDIGDVYRTLTPLDPDIRTAVRIVPGGRTSLRCGQEYCIELYSERKDGYLQNIGYLGEQLDLYLASRNIGALWNGIGKPDEQTFDGLDYVIMFAVAKIGDESKFRKDMFRSRRKPAEEIWEGEQIPGVTDIVRFAPSACNSQPWFVRNGGGLSVYRYRKPGKRGIMPAAKVPFYNRIDIGIFLCFLEICLQNAGFRLERELFRDGGDDGELTLNAKYTLQ